MHRRPALATLAITGLALAAGTAAGQQEQTTGREIPAALTPPPGHVRLFELGATGDQIYTCQESEDDPGTWAWTFQAPEAALLNAAGEEVGDHGAGPYGAGFDGSRVVGAVLERADAPERGDIPWLLLEATERAGGGVFSTVTHVQRLDTEGGVAPAEGCDAGAAGEELRVPYQAVYAFFYPAAEQATPAIGS